MAVLTSCAGTPDAETTARAARDVVSEAAGIEPSTASPTGADTPVEAETPASHGDPSPQVVLDQLVIVTLAVDWRPESELTAEEVRAQRARIAAAEAALLDALGHHGAVRRRLEATAQLALRVDGEGRRIATDHAVVAAVDDDDPEPAD